MHSIINNASNVVNFLDYTTLTILGGSAVVVGQSLLARLRNEWVAKHAPQPTPKPEALNEQVEVGWFRKVSVPESSAVVQDSPPTTSEVSAHEQPSIGQSLIEDPWHTDNQTACKLPKTEATMARMHASNKRLLKEGSLDTQQYRRMKKQKLIEIARAKGLSGANKKKTKGELIAKLSGQAS